MENGIGIWVVRRLTARDSQTALEEAMRMSFLISADAVHRNYKEKHEECHKPDLHEGVIVKINVNQRYATKATVANFEYREALNKIK
ncbi:hypothetical protein LOAG_13528 [Loa loa]|uniref:aspartyl aminopeptidase n=1 Tax=Loa loa TaxID=7209 RepID=A0A1I7VF83_LOALO|nr:hypothetical protein LOAG_13528 [Loa loa]EFO14988.2 hypothetical protein LOAG_13528 [Loa loa]